MAGVLDHSDVDSELLLRIRCEYTDLPGLRLTAAQASRLLAIDCRAGQALLEELVDRRFLRRVLRRDGVQYVRVE